MIKDVIRRLQKASVRPNDFTSRYSELLERLWQRKDSEPQSRLNSTAVVDTSNSNQSNNPGPVGPYIPPPTRITGWYNGQQDEFSWLDLQAVGELVTGDGAGYGGVDGYSQFMTTATDWGDLGLMEGNDVNRFF
jgi:hypothetical protein